MVKMYQNDLNGDAGADIVIYFIFCYEVFINSDIVIYFVFCFKIFIKRIADYLIFI